MFSFPQIFYKLRSHTRTLKDPLKGSHDGRPQAHHTPSCAAVNHRITGKQWLTPHSTTLALTLRGISSPNAVETPGTRFQFLRTTPRNRPFTSFTRWIPLLSMRLLGEDPFHTPRMLCETIHSIRLPLYYILLFCIIIVHNDCVKQN